MEGYKEFPAVRGWLENEWYGNRVNGKNGRRQCPACGRAIAPSALERERLESFDLTAEEAREVLLEMLDAATVEDYENYGQIVAWIRTYYRTAGHKRLNRILLDIL